MPVRRQSFPTSGAGPAVEVRNPAGSITVTAVADATSVEVVVDPLNGAAEALLDEVTVEFLSGGPDDAHARPARLLVAVPNGRLLSSPRFALTVTVPAGGPVTVSAASADTVLRGRLSAVELTSASGDLLAESCTGLRVRTASGDVRAAAVGGDLTAHSASGALRVGDVAGSVRVTTASGDVALGGTAGDVDVSSASADVVVGRASAGEVRLRTVSGDAVVAVTPGLRLWLDLQSVSGRLDSQLAPSAGEDTEGDPASLRVHMRSVSGDLRVRRAG